MAAILHSPSSILPLRSLLFGSALFLTGIPAAVPAGEILPARQVQVTDSAGNVRQGTLSELGSGLLTLAAPEQVRLKTRDQVLMKFKDRTSVLAPEHPLVVLAGGDLLAVRPENFDDESLSGLWPRFPTRSTCKIRLETVRGVILEPPAGAAARARLFDQIFQYGDPHDSVVLKNGDLLTGEFIGLDERNLLLETSLGKSAIERTGICAMIFNPALSSNEPFPGEEALLSLVDGSRFRVTEVKFSRSDHVSMKTQFAGPLVLPLAAVDSLRFLGGCATYLSDIAPVEYNFEPFFDLHWPLRSDRSVAGGFLTLRGVEYPKGLGVHSRSAITYRLGGKFRRFHAVLGVDDSAAGRGSVVFEVLLDGKTAYKSELVTGTSPPLAIDRLDVTGAKLMTLSVDYGTEGDILDHADWCDALLIK